MLRLRRTLAPFLLLAALIAALAFAAVASAEIKIGEGTSPADPSLEDGEADLLKATATYDSTTGAASFEITTREAPESTPEAERPFITYYAVIANSGIPCTRADFLAAQERQQKEFEESGEAAEPALYPAFSVISPNRILREGEGPPKVPLSQAYGEYLAKQPTSQFENLVPGTKTASGDTITIAATSPQAINGAFNCAYVFGQDVSGSGGAPDPIVFPLTTKPEPPPVEPPVTPEPPKSDPAPQPPAPTKAAPAPAPGVLALAQSKPQALKVGKLATVRLTVSNPGGSPTGQGFLSLRAPKGVVIRGRRQKLPALLPGDSWTLTYRVRLTAKAKKRSTIAISGTSGALTTSGSLVVVPKRG
jgi:hypothetical protein